MIKSHSSNRRLTTIHTILNIRTYCFIFIDSFPSLMLDHYDFFCLKQTPVNLIEWGGNLFWYFQQRQYQMLQKKGQDVKNLITAEALFHGHIYWRINLHVRRQWDALQPHLFKKFQQLIQRSCLGVLFGAQKWWNKKWEGSPNQSR